MIKIGVETETCHLWFQNKDMDIFSFIDKAVEYGYDGVIINVIEKKNMQDGLGALGIDDIDHIKKVAEYIRARHLFVEVDTRGIAFEHLSHILEVAHLLGADILRTFVMSGQYSYSNLAGEYHEEDIEASIDTLRQILPLLEKYRIKLALENHELEVMDEVVEIVQKLDSPWVGILLDFGNMMMSWQEPITATKLSAPYLISTHVKDHIVTKHDDTFVVSGAPLGEGSINIDEILTVLYEETTLTRLNLEICNPYASPFQREPGTGDVYELGKGAFEIREPLISPDIVKPLDYYIYEGAHLKELQALQLQSMKNGIQFIRKAWDKVTQKHMN